MNKKKIALAVIVAVAIGLVWAWAALNQMNSYYTLMQDHPIIWDEQRTGSKPVDTMLYSYPMSQEELEEELYWDSLEEVACAVEAEAGNQGYKGKRLVARVLINRKKSELFPDNYHDIIYQRNQFEVVANGSINCVPTEETYRAVRDELASSSDDRILFFTAGRYNPSGTPLFQYKDHYFSGR